MTALYALYIYHPYYRNAQFTLFRAIYPCIYSAWWILGVPYVLLTIRRFSGPSGHMRDGGLHLLAAFRAVRRGRFWRLVRRKRIRTTLLSIVVKAFYVPLMTGFVANHLTGITRASLERKQLAPLRLQLDGTTTPFEVLGTWWRAVGARWPEAFPDLSDVAALVQPWNWTRTDFSWGLGVAYDFVFALDCGWALMGYVSESRWLGNKTRSVEPTALGWAACLACYPPFNNVTGTYLPLTNGPLWIQSGTAQLVLRAGVVLMFAIYASATVSFGFKFSNLTNRGIISRGPYRFIRHPAYVCKCTAWWLEHLPTLTIAKGLFLTLLCGLYAVRAWTEERHLSQDPDYRAYKKKTPWVLFPGVY